MSFLSHFFCNLVFLNCSLHSVLLCISFRCTGIVVRQSYALQSGPSCISSTHLKPYILISTILLTLFPMLYFTSLWLFYHYQFVLPNPSPFLPSTPNPLLSGNLHFVLYIYEPVPILFIHLFYFHI